MQVCLMFGLSRRDHKNLRICFHLKDFSSFFLHPHGGFPREAEWQSITSFMLLELQLSFSLLGCVYRCFAAIRMLQRSDVGVLVKWYFHLSIKLELLVFILLEDILFYTKDFLMIFRNDVVHFVVRRNTHTHTHTQTHTHKHNFGHEKNKDVRSPNTDIKPICFLREWMCLCWVTLF